MLKTIQWICSMKQKHTKYTQINTNKSTHSEMGLVWQNPIQRTVRTTHLSVLMTVHSFSTQYNTEQFSSYLQTNIIDQMLSIEREGHITTGKCLKEHCTCLAQYTSKHWNGCNTNTTRRKKWVNKKTNKKYSEECRLTTIGLVYRNDAYNVMAEITQILHITTHCSIMSVNMLLISTNVFWPSL